MHIKKGTAFWSALLFTLLGPTLFPKLHLLYFSPYLVLILYRTTLLKGLWIAYFCGVILDLLSSEPLFGVTSINFCLVNTILFKQTRHFFVDKLSTLPLMTFFYSLLSTFFSLIFSTLFGHHYPISLSWIVTDLFAMPLGDALYALLVFSLPYKVIYRIKRFFVLKKAR